MGITLSLATIYNTLHQFTNVGLLKEIKGIGDATWFDTNIDQHHHFFDISNDHLIDIPASLITISNLPASPDGKVIDGIECHRAPVRQTIESNIIILFTIILNYLYVRSVVLIYIRKPEN